MYNHTLKDMMESNMRRNRRSKQKHITKRWHAKVQEVSQVMLEAEAYKTDAVVRYQESESPRREERDVNHQMEGQDGNIREMSFSL